MSISIRGMAPLLQVFDMPKSLGFYCDILGFEIIHTSAPGRDCDWALIRLEDAVVMLNTAYEKDQRPPSPVPDRIAGHDDTCLYFSCYDIDSIYQYLRKKGLDINKPNVARYGMKQIYLHDPDGYSICFHCPTGKAR